jgi:hypothetical protein
MAFRVNLTFILPSSGQLLRKEFVLLAAVFAIAGMLLYWSNSLVSKSLTKNENTTALQTDCTSALFILYSGKYDSSTKNLVLVVENKRSNDLNLESVYLFYQNEMKTFTVNDLLKGNQLKSIGITGVDAGFDRGIVKTNCPEVSVEFTPSQLT